MTTVRAAVRGDCLVAASAGMPALRALAGQRLAITGGTGFLGTWIAEMVAALNDEFQLRIKLDVFAPGATAWLARNERFASRLDIRARDQDVRSSFEFTPDVRYVVHAAGVPDGRVNSSDPLRVFQTSVQGTANVLDAASKIAGIARVLNVSSGLVYGGGAGRDGLAETDFGSLAVGQVNNIYAEAKRAAEGLSAIYRSQLRLPIVTVRPFTFVGPFQDLNRPWALNNFLRDALGGAEIRVHGSGETRRSYLYGADAACWSLVALLEGENGRAYNLGSEFPVSLRELAATIAELVPRRPAIRYRTLPAQQLRESDFYPSITLLKSALKVQQTKSLTDALRRTLEWHDAGST